MKILHFSATDGLTGAGGAAARIHQGLIAQGVNSRFCVVYPTMDLDSAFSPRITFPGRIARKLRRTVDDWLVHRASKQYDYLLSTGACGYNIRSIVEREQPDIVQLHLIGFHTFRLTSLAGLKKPVVWRFPDQWAFCGLAHYEPDPEKYATPPQAPSWHRPWTNLSEHIRYRKLATYRTIEQLVAVCPSRWLAAEAKRSALFSGRAVELIPTSCDTELFAPKDRMACRSALGLPLDKPIVLVGAGSLELRSKGLDLFIEAMNVLSAPEGGRRDIQVVTFGKDAFDPALLPHAAVRHLGHVADRRLLSILYNAANVFAAPSRVENLANTVLESLACGTPVVAFEVGGMPDAIDHEVNGYLAPPFDTKAFAQGLRWCLERRDENEIRAACRDKVLTAFSREAETSRFISLYERLLSAARS